MPWSGLSSSNYSGSPTSSEISLSILLNKEDCGGAISSRLVATHRALDADSIVARRALVRPADISPTVAISGMTAPRMIEARGRCWVE
jgi:hypothetical protein